MHARYWGPVEILFVSLRTPGARGTSRFLRMKCVEWPGPSGVALTAPPHHFAMSLRPPRRRERSWRVRMSCGSGRVAEVLVPRSHAATRSITAHAVASARPTPSVRGCKGHAVGENLSPRQACLLSGLNTCGVRPLQFRGRSRTWERVDAAPGMSSATRASSIVIMIAIWRLIGCSLTTQHITHAYLPGSEGNRWRGGHPARCSAAL